MAIEYAGGTRINTTFAADTRPLLTAAVEAQLVAAGWSVISGSGTADIKFQCATTAQSCAIRMRMRDPGSGTKVYFSLENVAGTLVGASVANGPALETGAGKVYRIIANRYGAALFTPGHVVRESLFFGTCWIPSFLTGFTDLGYLVGNAQSDIAAGPLASFRSTNYALGSQQCIIGPNLWSKNNSASAVLADLHLVGISSGKLTASYRWHDDTLNFVEPLISWGAVNTTDEAKIRGQMFDAIWKSDVATPDTTITFDGGTWHAITTDGSTPIRGCLYIRLP